MHIVAPGAKRLKGRMVVGTVFVGFELKGRPSHWEVRVGGIDDGRGCQY
jgi:hypothetical protein